MAEDDEKIDFDDGDEIEDKKFECFSPDGYRRMEDCEDDEEECCETCEDYNICPLANGDTGWKEPLQ
jgi:hypothetical protein